MLDNIVLTPSGRYGRSWTAGTLAEALFFYRNVHLFIYDGAIADLMKRIGVDNFRRLINHHLTTVHYVPGVIGVENTSGQRFKMVQLFSIGQNPPLRYRESSELPELGYFLSMWLQKRDFTKEAARRLTREFRDKLKMYFAFGELAQNTSFTDLVRREFEAQSYVADNLKTIASLGGVSLNSDFQPFFRIKPVAGHQTDFTIETNIDFARINNQIAQSAYLRDIGELTPQSFINLMGDILSDFYLSHKMKGDIVTNELSTRLSINKYKAATASFGYTPEKIHEFQEHVFEDLHLSHVIDTDAQQFGAFLNFLEHKETVKFRKWVHSIPNFNEDAISEYEKYAKSTIFWNRTPVRMFRIVAQFAAGVGGDYMHPGLGNVTGTAASIADSFLLENIKIGWRPDFFVNGRLRKFLRENARESTHEIAERP